MCDLNINNLTRQSSDTCYHKNNIDIVSYLNVDIPTLPQCYNKMIFEQPTPTGYDNIPDTTNRREKNQLQTRPYLGSYMGAGTLPTSENIDLETTLIQGVSSNLREKSTLESRNASFARFECLPEFGNPQRVERIIYNWTRGGEDTRNYIRREDYYRRCSMGQKY